MVKRIRLVLLILVAAGAIWNTFDAYEQIAILPPDTLVASGPDRLPNGDINWDARQHSGEHERRITAIWIHAWKADFEIAVVAICVWTLLPLAVKRARGRPDLRG